MRTFGNVTVTYEALCPKCRGKLIYTTGGTFCSKCDYVDYNHITITEVKI